MHHRETWKEYAYGVCFCVMPGSGHIANASLM